MFSNKLSFKHSRTSLIQIFQTLRQAQKLFLFFLYSLLKYFQVYKKTNNFQHIVHETYTEFCIILCMIICSSVGWLMALLHQLTCVTLSMWHRVSVTLITLPPHGYSSSCSARQMMTSACSQWAHNDHSQTKGQHMLANSSLNADLVKLSRLDS